MHQGIRKTVVFFIAASVALAAGTGGGIPFGMAQETGQDSDSSKTSTIIQQRMQAQVTDWNEGDIDGFMKVYWRSPELSFSSGGKTVRGWQQTLDGYKKRYPDRETMGKLSFDDLQVTELNPDAALVLGKWHLERQAPHEPIGGNFSLIFRQLDGEWLIVHDHTSVLKVE